MDALPKCGDITHVGDNLSPWSSRVPRGRLGEFLSAFLENDEHHYFVLDDRTPVGAEDRVSTLGNWLSRVEMTELLEAKFPLYGNDDARGDFR